MSHQDNQEVFDTGRELITIAIEHGRKGVIITAFVHGCSIRSGSLHIERIRELFLNGIIAICGPKTPSAIMKQIENRITETVYGN